MTKLIIADGSDELLANKPIFEALEHPIYKCVDVDSFRIHEETKSVDIQTPMLGDSVVNIDNYDEMKESLLKGEADIDVKNLGLFNEIPNGKLLFILFDRESGYTVAINGMLVGEEINSFGCEELLNLRVEFQSKDKVYIDKSITLCYLRDKDDK